MKGMLEYSPCLHFAMFQSLCLVLILPTFSDLMVRGWYWFHFIITCTLFHVSECSKSSNSARNKQQFEKCEYVSGNIFLSIIMKLSEFSEYSLPKSSEVCPETAAAGAVYCVWCFPHGSPLPLLPPPPLLPCGHVLKVIMGVRWNWPQLGHTASHARLLLCWHLRSLACIASICLFWSMVMQKKSTTRLVSIKIVSLHVL